VKPGLSHRGTNIGCEAVVENRVLRKIFGPRWDEGRGEWRRIHNREHYDIAHLRQECHNSKSVIFFSQERILKFLKFYNFPLVQRRHNCSPAASFANCVMTLYLLKVHLQINVSFYTCNSEMPNFDLRQCCRK